MLLTMGRGAGKNNLSKEELRDNKRERDAANYQRKRTEITRKNALAQIAAPIIACPCGLTYKNYKEGKRSHYKTHKHELWEEETEQGLVPLVCQKIKQANNTETARLFINNHYLDNNKFSAAEKMGYVAKFVRLLNKLPDKPPPPLRKVKLFIRKAKPDTN